MNDYNKIVYEKLNDDYNKLRNKLYDDNNIYYLTNLLVKFNSYNKFFVINYFNNKLKDENGELKDDNNKGEQKPNNDEVNQLKE
jgi:hypothetical protein